MNRSAIAILGGTGDQGLGLALRFAQAGRPVIIGSRKLERAVAAAGKVREAVPDGDVVGLENADATARAPIVILSARSSSPWAFPWPLPSEMEPRARSACGKDPAPSW
jgi:predicted dinucleotide-binding enzyme